MTALAILLSSACFADANPIDHVELVESSSESGEDPSATSTTGDAGSSEDGSSSEANDGSEGSSSGVGETGIGSESTGEVCGELHVDCGAVEDLFCCDGLDCISGWCDYETCVPEAGNCSVVACCPGFICSSGVCVPI